MRLVPVTHRAKRIAGKLVRVNVYASADVGQAAGAEVGQLVDKRRTGEVWDGASTVANQVVPRDEFISNVAFASRFPNAQQATGEGE